MTIINELQRLQHKLLVKPEQNVTNKDLSEFIDILIGKMKEDGKLMDRLEDIMWRIKGSH